MLNTNYCRGRWKRRFARWEYITLVLIVGTLEPISGKSLFLLRSYRLIHNYFPHARLKIVFEKFGVYLCNDESVITFSRRDNSMCLISSVSTYIHSNVHNSIVCARARIRACVFKVLHESIQLCLLIYLLNYLLTYLLTPCSRVLLETPTGSQLGKKFPVFYGTRRLITAFTTVRHLSLSWAT